VATVITKRVVDDIDRTLDAAGTYRFVWEGTEYEIDLSDANLERLHSALKPFITAGRRLPKNKAPNAKKAASAEMRRWWAEHVDDKQLPPWRPNGQFPREVSAAYGRARREPNS
jgi:hypothetical protein